MLFQALSCEYPLLPFRSDASNPLKRTCSSDLELTQSRSMDEGVRDEDQYSEAADLSVLLRALTGSNVGVGDGEGIVRDQRTKFQAFKVVK